MKNRTHYIYTNAKLCIWKKCVCYSVRLQFVFLLFKSQDMLHYSVPKTLSHKCRLLQIHKWCNKFMSNLLCIWGSQYRIHPYDKCVATRCVERRNPPSTAPVKSICLAGLSVSHSEPNTDRCNEWTSPHGWPEKALWYGCPLPPSTSKQTIHTTDARVYRTVNNSVPPASWCLRNNFQLEFGMCKELVIIAAVV